MLDRVGAGPRLPVVLALVASLPSLLGAQAPVPPDHSEQFAAPLAEGRWFGGTREQLRDGSHGLRIDGPAGVTLTQLPNPRTLHFDLHAAGGAPAVVVDRSCDAGTSWTRVSSVEVRSSPTPVTVALDTIGSCQVRWTVPGGGAATAWIANLAFYSLTPEQVARVRMDAEIHEATQRAFISQTVGDARAGLRRAGDQAVTQAAQLAEIVGEAYLFASLNQFGSAVGRRAELVNPLNYAAFTQLVDSLKPIVPPVIRNHLEGERTSLDAVVAGIVKAAAGNWIGAVSDVAALVPQLRAFRSNFQSVLAVVVSDRKRVERYSREAKRNPEQFATQLYARSNGVLAGLAAEADSLASAMQAAADLARRNRELAERAERHLANLLDFAGMGDRVRPYRIAVRERNRGNPQADAAVVEAYDRAVAARIAGMQTRDEMDNARHALTTEIQALAAIGRERRQLIAEQKTFFANQVNYLCAMRPEAASPAFVAEWTPRAAAAVREMRAAQEAFHAAVSNEEPPRPRSCPNEPVIAQVR